MDATENSLDQVRLGKTNVLMISEMREAILFIYFLNVALDQVVKPRPFLYRLCTLVLHENLLN